MTDVVQTTEAPPRPGGRAVKLVDCDVHAQPTPPMLAKYMSKRVRSYVERYGRQTPSEMHTYPRARGGGMRVDAWPDKPGHRPGSDPELLRTQLLNEWGVDYAVLEVMASLDSFDEPAVAAGVLREQILCGNALDLYGFPRERSEQPTSGSRSAPPGSGSP
jgi:hypothetical protein